MADQTASFAVELDVTDVQKGTADAGGSLEKLRSKIEAEQKALREMQSAMSRLKGPSVEVAAAKKDLAAKITASKESLGQAQAAYLKGGGALDKIGKKALEAGAGMKSGGVEVGKMGSALATTAGESAGASGALAGLRGVLSGGVVTAVIAFTVAVIAAAAAVVYYAFKAADAARSARLMTNAMAGGEEAGGRLAARINSLARVLPLAKTQLSDIAKALADKGLSGGQLEYALGAIARSTAVLGSTAGGKIQSIIEKSKELKRFTAQALDFTGTGLSIDDVALALARRTKTTLAMAKESIKAGAVDLSTGLQALDDATKNKLGEAGQKMSLSFDSIGERAKANFAGIFGGLDPEPVLKLLSEIVDLFDQTSASGKALSAIASTMLNPLFGSVTAKGPMVVGFIKGCVIGALRLALAFLVAKNMVKAFLADPSKGLADLGAKLVTLGSDMIDGLVKGIKEGAAKVVKAVTGVVGSGIEAARELLKVNSPSKVFQQLGHSTMEGFELGVEDGAPAASAAVTRAMGGTVKAGTGAAGSGGSRASVVVNHLVVNVNGADDSGLAARVKAAVIEALRDAVTMVGAPEPA